MNVSEGGTRPHPLERHVDAAAYVVSVKVNRAGSHAAAALGDGALHALALTTKAPD